MTFKKIGFCLMVFLLVGITGYPAESSGQGTAADREMISKTLEGSLIWLRAGSPEKLGQWVYDPGKFLMIGPFGKAFIGLQGSSFWPNAQYKYISYNLKGLHLVFSQKGDCAWFYQVLHLHFSTSQIKEDWFDLRWSGTLVKKEGKWLLALLHFSLPDGKPNFGATKEAQFQNWEKQPVNPEYAEAVQALSNSIGWVKNKDLEMLYGIIMNSTDFLEIHPEDNVVKSFENFKQNERFWMHPNFTHVNFDISDLRFELSPDKNCAWFYCVLNDRNQWQGRLMSWENTRWTGFMEKIDGKWRLWHSHFSYAEEPQE